MGPLSTHSTLRNNDIWALGDKPRYQGIYYLVQNGKENTDPNAYQPPVRAFEVAYPIFEIAYIFLEFTSESTYIGFCSQVFISIFSNMIHTFFEHGDLDFNSRNRSSVPLSTSQIKP